MAYQSTLSQDEVDGLLASLSGEESPIKKSDDQDAGGVRAYDLGSADRVVRRRMQTLELINERFARRMRSVFLNFIRRNADVTVEPLRVLKYSDFERNLPVPSNLNMVKLDPLRGVALFAFDPTLVFLIIETLFGGTGRSNTRIEGRDFTATEQRIIQRLLNHTLEAYTDAWESVYPLEYTYIRSEMHTKFASVTDANEVVIVTPVRIELGPIGGLLNVCMPYSMIEPIRDLLTRPYQDPTEKSDDTRWTGQLSSQLHQADVELVAKFATIDTTLGDLMLLQAGSVLPFELQQSISACIQDVPVLECGYGTGANGKHYALSVKQHLEPDSFDFLSEKK